MSSSMDILSGAITTAAVGVIGGIAAWVRRKLQGADAAAADVREFIRGMFPTCFRGVENWSKANPGAPSEVKLNKFQSLLREAWIARYGTEVPAVVRLQAEAYASRHALVAKGDPEAQERFRLVLAAALEAAKHSARTVDLLNDSPREELHKDTADALGDKMETTKP